MPSQLKKRGKKRISHLSNKWEGDANVTKPRGTWNLVCYCIVECDKGKSPTAFASSYTLIRDFATTCAKTEASRMEKITDLIYNSITTNAYNSCKKHVK